MENTLKKEVEKAYSLYRQGKYKEVIVLVDSVYGWKEDELGRKEYTKEIAEWCLKQLWAR